MFNPKTKNEKKQKNQQKTHNEIALPQDVAIIDRCIKITDFAKQLKESDSVIVKYEVLHNKTEKVYENWHHGKRGLFFCFFSNLFCTFNKTKLKQKKKKKPKVMYITYLLKNH